VRSDHNDLINLNSPPVNEVQLVVQNEDVSEVIVEWYNFGYSELAAKLNKRRMIKDQQIHLT
jgi:hypothetical protein